MRVLVALDGSPASERARELVSTLAWPRGSTLRVVSAFPLAGSITGWPGVVVSPEIVDEIEAAGRDAARAVVDAAVGKLSRPDLHVAGKVTVGRAADVILDAAASLRADLIVVGGRGLGPFESALLGSVSAEVVDAAPCPVLIARAPRVSRILLAEDGSEGARAAADRLRTSPVLHDRPVLVLSVAEADAAWHGWLRPFPQLAQPFADAAAANRATHAAYAQVTAARLVKAGLTAEAEVQEGNPAHRLVETAVNRGADLIVIGTRGRTGLPRFLLGSVVRRVLWHAPCSVLVVRGQPGEVTEGGGTRT
jgi:nucleotide-binding universal stress UspA family protein